MPKKYLKNKMASPGDEIAILLLGKEGCGKSALGNFLLNDPDAFQQHSGLVSDPKADCKEGRMVDNVSLRVVDSPGVPSGINVEQAEKDEWLQKTGEALQGVDALDFIFYVHDLSGRFVDEDRKVVQLFEKKTGPDAFWPFVCVVFTHSSEAGTSDEEQRQFITDAVASSSSQSYKWLMENVNENFITVELRSGYKEEYRETKAHEILECMKRIRASRQTNQYRKEDIISAFEDHCSVLIDDQPTSGDGGAVAVCFPGDALVVTEEGGPKLMKDLQVGENVLCVKRNGEVGYSRMFCFLHYLPNQSAQYLSVETMQGRTIHISANHLIFTAKLQPVLAGEIKEGDSLIVCDEQNQPATSQVTKIHTVQKQGVYAPLTRSGVIVVDGVMASCYASFHSHDLAHVAFAPLRLYSSISNGPPQPKEGIHGYAMSLYKAVKLLRPHSLK